MGSQNSACQVPITDCVTNDTTTEDLELVAWEIGDLLIIGTGLRVAESDYASDLVLHAGGKVFDGAVVDGCALAVKNN